MIGPFPNRSIIAKQLIRSPLGAVWKIGRPKVRLIHDLSFGKTTRTSVNLAISKPNKYIRYISTREVIQMVYLLGHGAWLSLLDMAEGYRQVHISPHQWRYLGFEWYGHVYAHTCLPFGLASSCRVFAIFAGAIRDIAVALHPNLFKMQTSIGSDEFPTFYTLHQYVDDFFCGHVDKHQAMQQFYAVFKIMEKLGVPTQMRKCKLPNQIQVILGFLYNTLTQRISLPIEKIILLCDLLDHVIQSAERGLRLSRRDIARITGKLNHACAIMYRARAFVIPLESKGSECKSPWDTPAILLSDDIIDDLRWWRTILPSQAIGIPFTYALRAHNQGDIHIWTDASTTIGMGAYSSLGHYFQIQWNTIAPMRFNHSNYDINQLEMLAVAVALTLWKDKLRFKSITIHCDNTTTVWSIRNRGTRTRTTLQALRAIATMEYTTPFYAWITYIKTHHNIIADRLSRFQAKPFEFAYAQLQHVNRLSPNLQFEATHNHEDIITAIQDIGYDSHHLIQPPHISDAPYISTANIHSIMPLHEFDPVLWTTANPIFSDSTEQALIIPPSNIHFFQ